MHTGHLLWFSVDSEPTSVDIVVVRVIRKLKNSATGPWLLTGLLITNSAAAIPFGISDTSPGSGPNSFEWAVTIAFVASVILFTFSIWLVSIRVAAAVTSGALWFGTAIGDLVSFQGNLDVKTITAFFLLPLGLSVISFGLARVAQVEVLAQRQRP